MDKKRVMVKTCPFCGRVPSVRIDSLYLYYVHCANLACTARDTRWFKSHEDAIAAWNLRDVKGEGDE